MPKIIKTARFFFSAFCLLLIGACVLFLVFGLDRVALVDNLIGFNYTPSAEMQTLSSHLGLTKTGERILRASHPELQAAVEFNQSCSSRNTDTALLGCYAKNRIYVYNITNLELDGIKESVLAHELLHAVWARTDQGQQDTLKTALAATYRDHQSALADHMKYYDETEYYDELHSLIGTQIPSSRLPQDLQRHYAEIFEDQTRLVGYFEQYNQKFTALKVRSSELYAKISENREQITKLKADYEAARVQLDRDITSFNQAAASGTLDTANFHSQRSALLARQTAIEQTYDNLVYLIDSTNQLIKEYNQNAASANALAESINSQLESPAITPNL